MEEQSMWGKMGSRHVDDRLLAGTPKPNAGQKKDAKKGESRRADPWAMWMPRGGRDGLKRWKIVSVSYFLMSVSKSRCVSHNFSFYCCRSCKIEPNFHMGKIENNIGCLDGLSDSVRWLWLHIYMPMSVPNLLDLLWENIRNSYPATKGWYFLDLCVSSLRRGHANLLCIVPILTDDSRRRSNDIAISARSYTILICKTGDVVGLMSIWYSCVHRRVWV